VNYFKSAHTHKCMKQEKKHIRNRKTKPLNNLKTPNIPRSQNTRKITGKRKKNQITKPKRNTKEAKKLANGPFLASSVPNLGLNDLAINIQAASSELNTDSRLRLQTEFITSES